jgi:hypothetical protein
VREEKIQEGVLRCLELKQYLEKNNLPLMVSLSEDATRIINRVQYDSATNQLVGFALPFDKNGMPSTGKFPARSAFEIEQTFLMNSDSVSNLVNIIVAQPLALGIPSFCLLMFGSNNKYSALDVAKRWRLIKQELDKVGIHVLAIGSDSDPKYNAAMKFLSELGKPSTIFPDVSYFQCKMFDDTICIQDTEHISTKLRNALLNEKLDLTIGDYQITIKHLKWLIKNESKAKHNLTPSTINPTDKQNFDSVMRMCDPRVVNLLSEKVSEGRGTILYLTVIRNIIDSFNSTYATRKNL